MEWQTAWGLQDNFTLREAILLTCEINPSDSKIKNGSRALPEIYEPLFNKLVQWRKENPSKNEAGISVTFSKNLENQKISRICLVEWLETIGLKPTTFFTKAKPIGYRAYLDKSHPHYSKKLAASVLAWEALSEEPCNLQNKTPKTAATGWVVKNKIQLGLAVSLKEEVNPATLDQIGRIVNWSGEGSPARTKAKKK